MPITYELQTFVIFPAANTNVNVYLPVKQRNTSKQILQLKTKKLLPITYTPDFTIELPEHIIFIETKGKPNDVYPLKRKLFLHYLAKQKTNKTYWFFEPHNQQQVKDTYTLIQKIINDDIYS